MFSGVSILYLFVCWLLNDGFFIDQVCGALSAVGFALIHKLHVKNAGAHESDLDGGTSPIDEQP